MLNLLKGFIIGIGKIIPGVSGSVLAITLGVYDKSVEYINNFKHNKKESLKYLLPLGIGIIISIIIFSKIITILLDKYYQITMLFFIGLIIGGLPEIIKKVKKTLAFFRMVVYTLNCCDIDSNEARGCCQNGRFSVERMSS